MIQFGTHVEVWQLWNIFSIQYYFLYYKYMTSSIFPIKYVTTYLYKTLRYLYKTYKIFTFQEIW